MAESEIISESHRSYNPPKLFYASENLQSRMILLLIKILELKLIHKEINLFRRDNLKARFMKINPRCTVPVLQDKYKTITEGRTILTYLTESYAPEHRKNLYPDIPILRAMVDQKLYFDSHILEPRLIECFYSTMRYCSPPDSTKFGDLEAALMVLEDSIHGHLFLTGDVFTLADLSLAVTISQILSFDFSLDNYGSLMDWYGRARDFLLPYDYDILNEEQALMMGNTYRKNSSISQQLYSSSMEINVNEIQ